MSYSEHGKKVSDEVCAKGTYLFHKRQVVRIMYKCKKIEHLFNISLEKFLDVILDFYRFRISTWRVNNVTCIFD